MINKDILKTSLIKLKNSNDKLDIRYCEALHVGEYAEDIESEYNHMQQNLSELISNVERLIEEIK